MQVGNMDVHLSVFGDPTSCISHLASHSSCWFWGLSLQHCLCGSDVHLDKSPCLLQNTVLLGTVFKSNWDAGSCFGVSDLGVQFLTNA